MQDYGHAVLRRAEGRVEVVEAADRIGVALVLAADEVGTVTEEGHLLLAGDPAHEYRPVGFAPHSTTPYAGAVAAVLVLERVERS